MRSIMVLNAKGGSGKSTIAHALSGQLDAIILRSDVERKRLFGMSAKQDAADGYRQGIYSRQASLDTYAKLAELSALVIAAGYSVIIDATFSDPRQRRVFYHLAEEMACRCVVLDLKVPESVLQQRILQRKHDVSDADIRVLQRQLASWQSLAEDEQAYAIPVDAENAVDAQQLAQEIRLRTA